MADLLFDWLGFSCIACVELDRDLQVWLNPHQSNGRLVVRREFSLVITFTSAEMSVSKRSLSPQPEFLNETKKYFWNFWMTTTSSCRNDHKTDQKLDEREEEEELLRGRDSVNEQRNLLHTHTEKDTLIVQDWENIWMKMCTEVRQRNPKKMKKAKFGQEVKNQPQKSKR